MYVFGFLYSIQKCYKECISVFSEGSKCDVLIYNENNDVLIYNDNTKGLISQ